MGKGTESKRIKRTFHRNFNILKIMTINKSIKELVNQKFDPISQKIDNISPKMVAYSTIEMGERKLSKVEKDTLRYITRPLRHLDFASDDFEMMDYVMFITPSKQGYNVSQLEFTHGGYTDDGNYPLIMINNTDTSTLNDAIKVIESIFNEKTTSFCDTIEGEKDVDEWYRTKDKIVIGVLLTRFKNSNNWIQLFIEKDELEIALHNSFDICIGHILIYYSC